MKPKFEHVIDRLALLKILCDFKPCVIGTPPLGIDVPTSDIDIACSAENLSQFRSFSLQNFSHLNGYRCHDSSAQNLPSVIVRFKALGWNIELFCQTIPTEQQWGVRHFNIEQRLIELDPRLKLAVQQLKQSGIKTEPVFAQTLGLDGDPYRTLLELEHNSDRELKHLMSTRIL